MNNDKKDDIKALQSQLRLTRLALSNALAEIKELKEKQNRILETIIDNLVLN